MTISQFNNKWTSSRHTKPLSCSLVAGIWLFTATAAAQPSAATEQSLDIPPQLLQEALLRVGAQFDISVIAPEAILGNRQAQALKGEYTLDEALAELLDGTGLEITSSSSGALMVTAIEAELADETKQEDAKLDTELNASPLELETVVVTGTKRNLSIQKEQTSVAVFTQREIEEQVLTDVQDIFLRAANVSTDANGTLNNVSIRGIELVGVGGSGAGDTATVYVDGSPNTSNSNQSAANLWDIAQVEILRGPQSTVQGRNALAGAVILQTADPEHRLAFNARGLVGNENNLQGSATVNIPIVQGELAFRASADYREVDFEVLAVNTGENTRFQEALATRAKLLWQPTDTFRLVAGYYADETDRGEFNQAVAPGPLGTPEFEAFDPFGRLTYIPAIRFESYEVDRISLDFDWILNGRWTITGLATYEDAFRDTDRGASGRTLGTDDTYTGELRAIFDYGALSGWVGAYYFDTEALGDLVFAFPLASLGVPVIPSDSILLAETFSSTATENRAIFADITYAFNDHWSINLGGRYDEESFLNTGLQGSTRSVPVDCIVAPFVPGIGGFPCDELFQLSDEPPINADFDVFLPRGSVIYNFDDLRSLSFTVAEGYRAGGSYIRAAPGEPAEQREFDPEFLTNYEVAFRSFWPDYELTVNANVFYSDWEDQQVSVPGPTGTLLDVDVFNAGSSRLYGLELEINKPLSRTLNLTFTLGLLDTEFRDFPFAIDSNGDPINPDDPTYANLVGNAFNSAPETTAALTLAYNGSSGWFASGNVSYASDQFSDVTNLELNKVGDYTLVNGRVGYDWQYLTVSAFVNNLFDERFAGRQGISNVSNDTGTEQLNQQPFFVVNDPRLYGVEVRFSY